MGSEKKPEWYQQEVQSINPEAQRLLESYSGFHPDEILPHVLKLVRGNLLFPCFFFFLSLSNS